MEHSTPASVAVTRRTSSAVGAEVGRLAGAEVVGAEVVGGEVHSGVGAEVAGAEVGAAEVVGAEVVQRPQVALQFRANHSLCCCN